MRWASWPSSPPVSCRWALLATNTTENQGHLMARSTEYAQDKVEQLFALAYGDATSDTRVFPAPARAAAGSRLAGATNTAAPVAGYVDYLDVNGNVLPSAGGAAPATWFYARAWLITSPRANLKQITVRTTVRAAALGGSGRVPRINGQRAQDLSVLRTHRGL